MLLLMMACTRTPIPPTDAPTSIRGEPVAFAPWFAPEITLSAAQPGDYRATLDYAYRGMISSERTVSRWVEAETSLTIAEDGTAHGCTTGTHGDSASESRFVSEDGENHIYSGEDAFEWGFRGRWERSGGWMLIWVDALAWQDCTVNENMVAQDLDGMLMCAQAALPGGTGIMCHPVGSVVSNPLQALAALPIGPTQQTQDGPGMDWSGRSWLVLGAGEGLAVSWHYRDGDKNPTVELGAP